MYLIFLDFDGVLVTEQSWHYWKDRDDITRKVYSAKRCCPIVVSNLNYVCKNVSDCNIVISSTWRKYYRVEDIKEILIEDGFKYADRIIGHTPTLNGSSRGTEIQTWLDESNLEVKNWVAIDDYYDNEIPKSNMIHTIQETGFTILDAYHVIELFNTEWKRPIFLM